MKHYSVKLLLATLVVSLLTFQPATAEEESLLDKMLTERIKMNEKYRDEYAKDAEDSPFAKDLVPLEKKIGQGWVDYLTYVRSLKNQKLKKQILKLELLGELSYCYYDLEAAEGLIEKASLRSKIAKWKKEIAKLESIDTEKAAPNPDLPAPQTGPSTP